MKRKFEGIWIPREIWLTEDLTLQEKVFLVEITSLDNSDGCFANNEYFANFFKLKKTRVSEVINGLVEKGFISSHIEPSKGNRRILKSLLKVTVAPSPAFPKRVLQETEEGITLSCKHNNTVNNTSNNIDANASPLISKSLKQPKKKKEKEPEAEAVHQDFVDAWYQFKKARTPSDEEVFLRSEDYRHLKEIREQLTTRKKGDKNAALATWQYILNNWGKLEDFLQKMADTSQVNRYMEKFLTDLRDKHENVTNKSPQMKNETLTTQQVDDLMGGLNPNYKPEPMPAPLFPLT